MASWLVKKPKILKNVISELHPFRKYQTMASITSVIKVNSNYFNTVWALANHALSCTKDSQDGRSFHCRCSAYGQKIQQCCKSTLQHPSGAFLHISNLISGFWFGCLVVPLFSLCEEMLELDFRWSQNWAAQIVMYQNRYIKNQIYEIKSREIPNKTDLLESKFSASKFTDQEGQCWKFNFWLKFWIPDWKLEDLTLPLKSKYSASRHTAKLEKYFGVLQVDKLIFWYIRCWNLSAAAKWSFALLSTTSSMFWFF